MKNKKLVIVQRINLYRQKANVIQGLQMAESFGDLITIKVLLDRPRDAYLKFYRDSKKEFLKYGINQNFEIMQFHNLYNLIPKFGWKPGKKYFYEKSARYVLENNIDYLFTRYEEIALLVCKHKPTILELHNIKTINNIDKLREFTNNYPLKIVGISDAIRTRLLEAGIQPGNVFVYHDCVNLKRFQDKAIKPLLSSDKKMVGYTGHFYQDRGIEMIIQSAQNNPEFDFYCIGGFKRDVKRYKSMIKGLKNIHFGGMMPYPQVPAFLKSCDYLIMPYSKKLGTIESCSPLKLFEYMAAGKVLISSNIPTVLEVLNEKNALLYEADDYEALQVVWEKIKKNDVDEKKLKAQALKDVEEYTWEKRAKFILEIFKELS